MAEDHYEVLGVDPDASEDTITAAYKDLLEELKEEDPEEAEERFELAKRAHEVLTDEDRRAAFDRRRERRASAPDDTGSDFRQIDIRIVAVLAGVLLAIALGEAVLLWSQSQEVGALEQDLAASEQRVAALEENVSALRTNLSETESELQDTRDVNSQYESLVNELADSFEEYKAIYKRCEESDGCSVLGAEDPRGKFQDTG